jgi:ABC-type hemin transport system substrate-binding protein
VELGKPDVLLAFPEHNQDALLRALRRAGVQVIEIDSQDVANLLPRKS